MFIRENHELWALFMSQMRKNSLFLLLGLTCMCVGDCVHAFMSVCIWVPFLTSVLGVFEGVTQPQNECERV